MTRFVCRVFPGGLIVLLLGVIAATVQAAPSAALRIRPLRAAGGEGGVERDLPGRLTVALTKFLREHAAVTVRVEAPERFDAALRAPLACYTLEGDLSYASAGEESGRYLLVTRLIREGKPDRLIGQWAGSASSLRYLTANLRNDPRVHTLGLVGEIGSRVLTAVSADITSPDQQWHALCTRLTTWRNSKVTIIEAETPYTSRPEIGRAETFRLRLPPTGDTHTYLVTCSNEGKLEIVPLTLSAAAQSPQLLSQPLHLSEGTREAWLLSGPIQGITTLMRPLHACPSEAEEDDAPIHILNGVGANAVTHQTTLTPLLAEIAKKPAEWRLQRLRITNRPQ